MASAEHQGCPPRVVRGSAAQASIASSVNQMGSFNRGPKHKLFFAGIVCRVQGRLRGWHGPPHDGASREEPSNVDAALC